jgi:chorismate mutase/prephenate dehydratase
MGLDDLRRRIDGIDDAILDLLEERAEVAAAVAREKRTTGKATYDPEREKRVIERLTARAAGKFPKEAIGSVYRQVMSACLALQEPTRVAYLGPEGGLAHEAARGIFGLSVRYIEQRAPAGVIDAVARGDATYGVVPLETASQGAVPQALDALIERDVHLRAEHILPASQHLLARASASAPYEHVYGPPEALAACRAFLGAQHPEAELREAASPAEAAREALADPRGAAVGGRLLAELYELRVVAERIQERADDATRFVVLGREDAPPTGHDRTTLVFSLNDAPGALSRALDALSREGLSLSRIESRPGKQRPFDYVFFVELGGHRGDPAVARALAALHGECPWMKVLGSYPRA